MSLIGFMISIFYIYQTYQLVPSQKIDTPLLNTLIPTAEQLLRVPPRNFILEELEDKVTVAP